LKRNHEILFISVIYENSGLSVCCACDCSIVNYILPTYILCGHAVFAKTFQEEMMNIVFITV